MTTIITSTNDPEIVAQRAQRVYELTLSGLSSEEIACILGVTVRTVVRHRRRTGCSQVDKAKPLTAEEHQIIVAILDDGGSVTEAARTIGRNQSTVHRHYSDRSWTRQQQSEYLKIVKSSLHKAVMAP